MLQFGFKKICFYFFLIGTVLGTVFAQANVQKWATTLPLKSKFRIESEFNSRVDFWIQIYSKYTTSQGVFHDVHQPQRVYGEIDLSSILDNSVLNEIEKKKRSNRLIQNQRNKIITRFKIKNPKSLRLQMGLKDRMQKAFYLSGQYLPMMEDIFKQKKLPIELTRIVFVESSFNIFAQSKVGASGLWQIMPSVGRAEGYLQKYYDKRNHPYYSTLLAADMLGQNYRSLKNWPLAITAYNHGLTGIRRMKSKVGSSKIQDLIESKVKTKSWGFASENFYACFLAVLEVERNALDLFGQDLIRLKPLRVQNIYLKTATHKSDVLKKFGGSTTKFKKYNPHLRLVQMKHKKYFPVGMPLVLPANSSL